MPLYIFALSCLYPFDSLSTGSKSLGVLHPNKDLQETGEGGSKIALISRKHSSYKCASWKAILLVMEHFQKVVPQIWQLGKHICWMGKHTGRLHPKEVLGLIPEDATNPFCLCRGPLLFPCQHCVIVWLEVRILPISKWQVFDNFSLLSLLCPDVAKFRWEPIRASLAC